MFVDRYALLFKCLAIAVGLAVVLMSVDYVRRRIRHPGEFYALVVFAVLGADLMASAGELLTAYVAVELLSFCLYVLVALSRGGRSVGGGGRQVHPARRDIVRPHALRHRPALRNARRNVVPGSWKRG